MSVYAMEQALFDIAALPPQHNAYCADPQGFLAAYRLQPEEARLIMDMDVRAMMDRAINPMLAMRAFTAVAGRAGVPEYMRRIQPRAN